MPTETQNQESYSQENYIKQIFRKEISVKNALSSVVVIGNCNVQFLYHIRMKPKCQTDFAGLG